MHLFVANLTAVAPALGPLAQLAVPPKHGVCLPARSSHAGPPQQERGQQEREQQDQQGQGQQEPGQQERGLHWDFGPRGVEFRLHWPHAPDLPTLRVRAAAAPDSALPPISPCKQHAIVHYT